MTDYELAITTAARVNKVAKRAVTAPGKAHKASEARMLVVRLLRHDGYTDREISGALNRGLTTIKESRLKGEKLMEYSISFRAKYEKCKAEYDNGKQVRKLKA